LIQKQQEQERHEAQKRPDKEVDVEVGNSRLPTDGNHDFRRGLKLNAPNGVPHGGLCCVIEEGSLRHGAQERTSRTLRCVKKE
jgi:hypothetical protein